MKIYVPIILILVICITMQTKAQIHLQGKVVDENKKGIEFVRIEILNDSNNKKNYFTDSNGNFSIKNLQKNKNIFRISIINYKTLDTIIENTNEFLLFTLVIDTQTLQAIEVNNTKSKIKRVGSKIYFIPGSNIKGFAFDALKLAPTLSVSLDNISMFAKDGVIISINDKRLNMPKKAIISYVRNIPISNILRIEITRLNLSENDANSNIGMINIVTKKHLDDGYYGSISSYYLKNENDYLSLSGNVTFNTKKIISSISLSLDTSNLTPSRSEIIKYSNEIWNTKENNFHAYKNWNVHIGLDYKILYNLSVGTAYNYNNDNTNSNNSSETVVYTNNQNKANKYLDLISDGYTNNNSQNINFNLNWKIDTPLGKKFSLSYDKLSFNSNSNQNLLTKYSDSLLIKSQPDFLFNSKNNHQTNNQAVRLDLYLPFKKYTFKLGGKYTRTEAQNNNYFYNYYDNILDKTRLTDDIFIYQENITAGYFSFEKSIRKIELLVGLRIEKSEINGSSKLDSNKVYFNYTNWFPSFNLSYTINEDYSLSFGYSKSIQRPDFNSLNPFKRYVNAISIANGNPFLQPYISHNIELTYIYGSNLNLIIGHSFADNIFGEFTIYDNETKLNYSTLENFQNWNASYFYYWHNFIFFNEKFNLLPTTTITYTELKSKYTELKNESTNWNGNFNLYTSYTFNKKIDFQIWSNFNYKTATINGIFEENKIFKLDAGIQFNLLKKKINVNFYFNDIFRTYKIVRKVKYNNIVNERFRYNNEQSIGINLQWTFNKGVKKNKNKIINANEEELKRIK